MATSVIPKSEIRRNDNISEGWGEVPAFLCEETGRIGWGLPGGEVTYNEAEARLYAGKLNQLLLRITKNPRQLLSAV